MKKHTAIILLLALAFAACKKNEVEKDYNTLRIVSGFLEGTRVNFSPNKGFWSQVTTEAKSFRLLFGDDEYPADAAEHADVFFYHEGNSTISFPGLQGTYVRFQLFVDEENTICLFSFDSATLSIEELSDDRMKGRISGEFTNQCNGESSTVEMDFDIELIQE